MPRDTGGIGFGHDPHIRCGPSRRRHLEGIEEYLDTKYIALTK
jgi:hypothetical protein